MRHIYCSLLAATFIWAPGTSYAADALSQLMSSVEAAGYPLPNNSVIRDSCDQDALCVAKFLRDRIGDGADLLPHEEKDRRDANWKAAPPALTRVTETASGELILEMARFDAAALLGAIDAAEPAPKRLVLDVRGVEESRAIDHMRRVLALFTGTRQRAFQVRHIRGQVVDWTIVAPTRTAPSVPLSVVTDAASAPLAKFFAKLMNIYAGAETKGPALEEKLYLRQAVPVIRGWVLMVPTATLALPDEPE